MTSGLDVAVRCCFCFVDTELPRFGAASINGFSIFGRRRLAKQLRAPGGLTDDRAVKVAAALDEHFPVAWPN